MEVGHGGDETEEGETNTETINQDDRAKKRARTGAAKYSTKFNAEWSMEWPFIKPGSTQHHFWCDICRRELECSHMGRSDIQRHIRTDGHTKKERSLECSKSIDSFLCRRTEELNLEAQTRRAEIKVAVVMVNHNIPLAFADHLSPLFKECFPDSKIARKYASARTKTAAIINGAVSPYMLAELVTHLREKPFSLSTDGSNDTGMEKMNPITIKTFGRDGVVHRFLDMGVTEGEHCGTAETIFQKIDSVLKKHEIPWSNCISLSVDNAAVNLGGRNSIKTRALKENPAMFILGCPCHIVHNNASAAGAVYEEITGFDIEEMAVDIGHWFRSSTKRKNKLNEFCEFCDATYMEVLLHVSIRWLSLESVVMRILRLYAALRSYFGSCNEKQARCVRLQQLFLDPMTEIHLLFYQSALIIFTQFNLLFQRQDPCIYLLHDQIRFYIRKLMSKFLKPGSFKEVDVNGVDILNEDNQLPDSQLGIGFTTRCTLNRLVEDGCVSPEAVKKFHGGARNFFRRSVEYARAKLPLNDEVLRNSKFVDFNQKMDMSVECVQYFTERFNHLLPCEGPREQDRLSDEYLEYQMLEKTDIPEAIWRSAVVRESEDSEYHRMDRIWGHLSTIKSQISGTLRFPRLAKVAKLILCMPHSNADAERVFSVVGLNKTDTRNRLSLDGTLSSIMRIKMNDLEPCYKYEPPAQIVKDSKSATTRYNSSLRCDD
ncbi:zinc finger BED domain-containing protein 5-like [Engraulis encrasicolus]|uniref:zinc finger BED domain-containing protein 5-like n=1 Tax=Engraulis encrasicolus TaxID=184585 RepID=UPI002FD1AF9B